jgi:hypothetical protein
LGYKCSFFGRQTIRPLWDLDLDQLSLGLNKQIVARIKSGRTKHQGTQHDYFMKGKKLAMTEEKKDIQSMPKKT